MSDTEKAIVKELAKALTVLTPEKQQFFIGYARGVADAVESREDSKKEKEINK